MLVEPDHPSVGAVGPLRLAPLANPKLKPALLPLQQACGWACVGRIKCTIRRQLLRQALWQTPTRVRRLRLRRLCGKARHRESSCPLGLGPEPGPWACPRSDYVQLRHVTPSDSAKSTHREVAGKKTRRVASSP